MAINVSKFLLRDIYSMIGREIVQFDPSDRVQLDINARLKDGTVMQYFIGGVYYDSDRGEMAFDMYNSKGDYISPARNAHLLSSLSPDVVKALAPVVRKYHEYALFRSQSIRSIEGILNGLPEGVMSFEDTRNPLVSIPLDGYGRVSNISVDQIFKDNGALLIQGRSQDGSLVTRNLSEITDLGISNIALMLDRDGRYSLDRSVETQRDRKPAKSMKM